MARSVYNREMNDNIPRSILKRLIGIAGVVIFIAFLSIVSFLFIKNFGGLVENPQHIREVVTDYGISGYLVFALINIFQILFAPIPGQVMTLSSGILFGIVGGIVVTWVSVMIGGTIAMSVSRLLGRKILDYLLDEKAKGFERKITKRGLPFIMFLAIFPNPIGDGLFYLAGITDLPLKILLPLIALGRLPGIVISVLIGDRILVAGIKGWIIGSIGFLLAALCYITFRRKLEALAERITLKYGI